MSEASAPKGLEAKLKRIADLIREKAGKDDLMNIDEMIQTVLMLDLETDKKGGDGQ